MKTSKYFKTIAICAVMLAAALPGKAQLFPKTYIDTWGFFMSPEIGVSIFPRSDYRLGFHVALYYSYATNSGDVLTYSINNINNFGIRVGISF